MTKTSPQTRSKYVVETKILLSIMINHERCTVRDTIWKKYLTEKLGVLLGYSIYDKGRRMVSHLTPCLFNWMDSNVWYIHCPDPKFGFTQNEVFNTRITLWYDK